MAYLSISDSVAAGEPRIVIADPAPARVEPPPLFHNTLDVLIAQQEQLTLHITRLEERIALLEARTWWSMLVAQARSWFTRQ